MTLYNCRTVRPEESAWFGVQASSPEEAANSFHTENLHSFKNFVFVETSGDGGKHIVHFALVEVEGHGEMVSRAYSYGIWRRGGVRSKVGKTDAEKLEEIADKLGWLWPPADLLKSDWLGEESLEDAKKRAAVKPIRGTEK